MMLVDLIIEQYERSSKWNNDRKGNSSFRIEEKHYRLLGKELLINEAKELEKQGLIKIRWVKGYYNQDIEKVEYPLGNLDTFYQRANRIPKYRQMEVLFNLVKDYNHRIRSPWIRHYTENDVLPRILAGTEKRETRELELLYRCLLGLDQLEAPMYKRIFSKRFLGNSKLFEKELEDKILRIARKYFEDIEDTMGDIEVLSQLNIEEYAQELCLKGSLLVEVDGSIIDTGIFPYGTVLNTQTLKKAIILDNPHLKRVLTIENKANYVAKDYEEGTLVIFSHGYFTPLEREFLLQLREKLKGQEVLYQHSGDLDYGGVRIFQYIRNRIFPKLQPYHMDINVFDEYFPYGEPMAEGPMDKLRQIQEPLLQDLINRMLETGLSIEQETFL